MEDSLTANEEVEKKKDEPREGLVIGEDDAVRKMRYRDEWEAKPSISELKSMGKPVLNVLLTFTGSPPCEGEEQCDKAVQELQTRYQREAGLPDLPYNFLVSKDGIIYEARGWDLRPFVPKKAFPRIRGTRLVIAQINTEFDQALLPPADAAIWDLIQHGVDNQLIHPNAEKFRASPWV